MNSPEFIKDIIAKLVTNVAMSFPVSSISKIAFFNGEKLQLSCSWNINNQEEEGVSVFPDPHQPAYYKVHNSALQLSDFEVTGIDTDGELFVLNSSLDKILQKTAA